MKAAGFTRLLIIFLLILGGCNSSLIQKPKVNFIAVISPVNSQDYKKLGGLSKIENPQQKDFKKFTLSVNIKNDKDLTYKNIEIPEIKLVFFIFTDDNIRVLNIKEPPSLRIF